MTARLKPAGEVAPPFEAAFGPTGALRQDFGTAGRAHVDRALPFLVLHRAEPGERVASSLARRVAVTAVVWQDAPAELRGMIVGRVTQRADALVPLHRFASGAS